MGADHEALQDLEADPRFGELNDYVPPLALVRAFGVSRDEVAHSRMLARLLDPRRHRGAGFVLGALLHEIAARPVMDAHLAGRLRAGAEGPFEGVTVHRERLLIDMVVEVPSPAGDIVVGIDNKIDAGEQPEQIARYQEALERAYPDRTALMIFLTPTGREPTTARAGGPVPALALGYGSILTAVEEARRKASPGSRDGATLGEVAAHLKEDILGDPEVKILLRELWKTHGWALQLAIRHRPQLDEMREPYVELLRQRYGEDARFYYWPERGRLREIKMDLSSWFEKGFPFTFMLYSNAEGRPRVRVLIYRDNYKRHAQSLAGWAPRVNNASAEPIIDEDFAPLAGWRDWRRILREEDDPPDAALEEVAFDAETVREAVDAVAALVELLRPHVEGTQPRT